ncbi:MAG TPA: phosphotransferase [Promineifilum sp.]|nr:phosphotransferase [Promineifilum sp.]
MLDQSPLSDDTLLACARERFGRPAVAITFLPLGYDANAWAYRLEADKAYFLKVRRGPAALPGLLAPRAVADAGIDGVLTPLPTTDGALWAALGDFTVTLQPFVAGRDAWDSGLSDAQWLAFGNLLRRVHALPVPPALAAHLVLERFVPDDMAFMPALAAHAHGAAHVHGPRPDDPLAAGLAACWRQHETTIATLQHQAAVLGEQLRRADPPRVLCHADAYLGNVLVGDDGRLWLIDWDGAALAPRERDLMFVFGGIAAGQAGPRETALFVRGYGPVAPDAAALTYYRCAWVLQDLASFGHTVLDAAAGEATRREALRLFKSNFAPGELAALALSRVATTIEGDHVS